MKALIEKTIKGINQGKKINDNYFVIEHTEDGKENGVLKATVSLVADCGTIFHRDLTAKESDPEKDDKEMTVEQMLHYIYEEMFLEVFVSGLSNMSFSTKSIAMEIHDTGKHVTRNRKF